MLSSQQAVDLVGKWLEVKAAKKNSQLEPTYEPFDFGQFWKGVSGKSVEGGTTVQDDNVAVHLVRNSLGGNHHELIAGRLAFSFPSSRRLRDDTTVQAVSFTVPDLEKIIEKQHSERLSMVEAAIQTSTVPSLFP